MQPNGCEYGSNLLILELDADTVEKLEDKAKVTKYLLVSESIPSLARMILCVDEAAKIFMKNMAHKADAAINPLTVHCEVDQRVCLPITAAFIYFCAIALLFVLFDCS